MNTYLISMIFGVVFVLVGILGFVPNPLVAPDGLFAVNAAHNAVHFITGLVFLIAATKLKDRADLVLKAVGAAYVLVTIIGALTSGNMLLGFIHINDADRWLHAGLAAAILGAGFLFPNPRST